MYTTIIASRVGEPLLGDTLTSVAAQTLPPSRVIVVVDTEATVPEPWAAPLRDRFPFLEILRNDGRGQVSAINHGIAQTSTPYVAFLDSDDLWLPEKQRKQVDLLERERDLDAAHCHAANFQANDTGGIDVDDSTPSIMFTCTTFRRATFERFGGLHDDSTHFTWLYRWWGAAKASGISTRCIDYVGLHRRLHDRNSWREQGGVAHGDLLAELRRHVARSRA